MTYTSLEDLLKAICDSIRGREGSTELIDHQDIPSRIDALSKLEAEELSDIHIWKKSTATEEYTVTETETANVNLSYYNPSNIDNWDTVKYADEIKVIDGEITLVNPTSITLNADSDYDVLLGKYVYSGNTELYYRIPEDATIKYIVPTYGTSYYIRASVAMELSVSTAATEGGELIGYVVSTDKSDYPEDGNVDDGFRYVYIGTAASVDTVETVDQGTPTISVSSAGLITASVTQTAGYVEAGTKSATKQLTTQAAKTYTPGTSDQTIESGVYLTGAQTIEGDSNLVEENIRYGKSIFGVPGSYTGEGSGGLVAKNGEVVDSTVIETGLSSVSYFMLYKTSFAKTGLIQAIYGNDDENARTVMCSSYGTYTKTVGISTCTPTIEGGTITWPYANTSSMGMSEGVTYKWVAFGEE